ncbi:MAG: YdcF family protein [Lachnospiraceae bacterium]|nr:YdcF family protein [Lachnospiraceae bacterium]
MVAYGAMALYVAAIVVYTIYYMRAFDHFHHFLYTIYETGFYFVVVAAPLMLILSFLFAFSNIWLVRHEGFRLVNLLGFMLGVACFTGTAFILFGRYNFYKGNEYIWDAFFVGAAYIVSFFECVFLFIMITAFLSTRHYPVYDKDYVIILGCGFRKDGTLTPLLKGRVDSALRFEKEQYEKTGKHAKFIPSGGQGPDEVMSESEAMKRYMLAQGIPEASILTEDKSTNTRQNIKYSKQVIEEDNGTAADVKAAFATTNYHIFRGYILSGMYGLDVEGISAKTKWYFFPNAFLREFVGLLVAKKVKVVLTVFWLFLVAWLVHMMLV